MKQDLYVANLKDINKILRNNPVTFLPHKKRNIYEYRCFDYYPMLNGFSYKITIRKTNSFMDDVKDYWYNILPNINIGTMEYLVFDDEIIIDRIYIHNTIDNDFGKPPYKLLDYYRQKHYLRNAINQEETDELMNSFIDYIKSIAIKEKKKKVIFNHKEKMHLFHKYFVKEGFVLQTDTEGVTANNGEWIVEEFFEG